MMGKGLTLDMVALAHLTTSLMAHCIMVRIILYGMPSNTRYEVVIEMLDFFFIQRTYILTDGAARICFLPLSRTQS